MTHTRTALAGLAASILATTGAAAEDAADWTPQDFAALEAIMTASADDSEQSVYALTVSEAGFAEEIATGVIGYLDSVDEPFNFTEAPDSVKIAWIRLEFLRDQTTPAGFADDIDGEAVYRSQQGGYLVDCATRELAQHGLTRFARNDTEGRAVYSWPGDFNVPVDTFDFATPEEGSHTAGLLAAVCDSTFVYLPAD
ncbi:hypothetical protein FF098_003045 [Parvularcula flava]|uniref:Uncharacterized protein n=1 Tax=Aquisalinus luteolus TaxID=1566827 RepID=A0A8J3A0Q5_9PROT|nr:hypothetical protein [Aquisalinus luteolus]NHK26883.1 hypothetical protein [Aquisalinus luteolus]GGH93704.1 hypothetical protein GCM10011355_06170 [Aquisalinus luteolus]